MSDGATAAEPAVRAGQTGVPTLLGLLLCLPTVQSCPEGPCELILLFHAVSNAHDVVYSACRHAVRAVSLCVRPPGRSLFAAVRPGLPRGVVLRV